ncbi:MBL fold metallo-hydrolase [Gynuella sunshinyii]|uniref:Putative Zn-dependent hydrolase of the beta-lactamase fold n=1 Tax=Gynuella sunshinyii YC6258 TaxID=1445510 RepID=A0A0C5VIR6_9GAMM|nr:MBL fold metallo-hydrolase [Gynuella sunshinyii]AJQ94156.1 putative Zn-dependent hydrolase of the beta-lactamase fold [Gynuella sunshinyii YC6258]
MGDSYYLKEDVYIEPLFNHWYAWPYLMAPATAARHLTNTHRRIMKSYVKNYELHILAKEHKALTGGDFVDCTEEQLEDIKQLIAEIEDNCSELVALSSDIKKLNELMASHVTGESIEYLYEQVPEGLKGYVELFMDMEHNPGYRLIEPLLYNSHYYRPDLQSISLGLISKVGDRPFVFSTPRLPDNNHLQLDAEFNDPFWDTLCRAREYPLSSQQIKELFDGRQLSGGLTVEELFTETPSQHQHQPVTSGIRLTYTGHAGFLIESEDVSILIDPVIASRGDQYANDVVSFSELPEKIDYICLTHNHQDHINIETLLQLRYKTGKILVPKNNGGSLADPSMKLILKQLKFTVEEMEDLDQIEISHGRITAIPFLGEHGDLNIRSKAAWLVELRGKKCFFGADSANPDINLYRHMQPLLADADVFAVGMECVGAPYTWLYGALNTKKVAPVIRESRRLNGSDSAQAIEMVKLLKPRQVFIYALGMEPWYKYFIGLDYSEGAKQIDESDHMLKLCEGIKTPAEKLFGRKVMSLVTSA